MTFTTGPMVVSSGGVSLWTFGGLFKHWIGAGLQKQTSTESVYNGSDVVQNQ